MNQNTLYIDNLFRHDYDLLLDEDYERKSSLEVEIVENGFVVPFKAKSSSLAYGVGGVIRSDGSYVKISQTKAESLMTEPEFDCITQRLNDEDVIYLGYFIKQWGHFLVDFIPRLWWLVDNYKGQKIVYLVRDSKSLIDGNYLEMLELFGIDRENIVAITEVTGFRKIIVPETAFDRPTCFSKELLRIRDKILDNLDTSICQYDKVYFTRRKLQKARNCEFGEQYIEKLFKLNGYVILSPEKCSLKEQISIFNKCKHIASLSGTIPHNILFGTEETDLIIINKTVRINTTQILLNQAIGCKTTYVDAFIALLPVSPATGPFWLDVNDNVLKFAENSCMIIPKRTTLSMRAKKKNLSRYFLAYCRNVNQSLDIGGKIIGSSRPLSEGYETKDIYYYYRNRIGQLDTDISVYYIVKNKLKKLLSALRKEI